MMYANRQDWKRATVAMIAAAMLAGEAWATADTPAQKVAEVLFDASQPKEAPEGAPSEARKPKGEKVSPPPTLEDKLKKRLEKRRENRKSAHTFREF